MPTQAAYEARKSGLRQRGATNGRCLPQDETDQAGETHRAAAANEQALDATRRRLRELSLKSCRSPAAHVADCGTK
jgi:hypothetical protein